MLKATRTGAVIGGQNNQAGGGPVNPNPPVQNPNQPAQNPNPPVQTPPAQNLPATRGNTQVADPSQVENLNGGVLDNIDGLGNMGNYVTMDGTEFLYKATNKAVAFIDLIISYGKRYYQWVEENGDNKTFHNSDTKIDDRYKLKFEIRWHEGTEDEDVELQFHAPTASAMRFINYVTELAKQGYGVGNVVTRMTITRQIQTGTSNRYSRAEFTMVGYFDQNGSIVQVNNGVSTLNMK
jgi:hypothetical protein